MDFSVQQVADILGVSTQQVRNYIRKGSRGNTLAATTERTGRTSEYRVTSDALQSFVETLNGPDGPAPSPVRIVTVRYALEAATERARADTAEQKLAATQAALAVVHETLLNVATSMVDAATPVSEPAADTPRDTASDTAPTRRRGRRSGAAKTTKPPMSAARKATPRKATAALPDSATAAPKAAAKKAAAKKAAAPKAAAPKAAGKKATAKKAAAKPPTEKPATRSARGRRSTTK